MRKVTETTTGFKTEYFFIQQENHENGERNGIDYYFIDKETFKK